MSFPPEICGKIAAFLRPGGGLQRIAKTHKSVIRREERDLVTLSKVSRMWHTEATRVLWEVVILDWWGAGWGIDREAELKLDLLVRKGYYRHIRCIYIDGLRLGYPDHPSLLLQVLRDASPLALEEVMLHVIDDTVNDVRHQIESFVKGFLILDIPQLSYFRLEHQQMTSTSLSKNTSPFSNVKQFLLRHPTIEDLDIHLYPRSKPGLDWGLIDSAQFLPRLRAYTGGQSDAAKFLTWPHLSAITLYPEQPHPSFSLNSRFISYIECLGVVPNVQKVELCWGVLFRGDVLKVLTDCFPNLQELSGLLIDQNSIDFLRSLSTSQKISYLPNLTHIAVTDANSQISGDLRADKAVIALPLLFPALRRCTRTLRSGSSSASASASDAGLDLNQRLYELIGQEEQDRYRRLVRVS
ncbi:hypothetical protein SISNIDRAFT_452210 [Sistotremastrum niveocremeum HHB9708]|uniref:F-box domain-containing protein n=1 Tax=Sistotremastrum niveocremeum HHB9708 TaxID=1314777 RepID=A0A164X1D3_9AGAM|nr:hypothetical protein SISNIDRAFT_452210 [Sistotremastrum niveocremeum HHB9708]